MSEKSSTKWLMLRGASSAMGNWSWLLWEVNDDAMAAIELREGGWSELNGDKAGAMEWINCRGGAGDTAAWEGGVYRRWNRTPSRLNSPSPLPPFGC